MTMNQDDLHEALSLDRALLTRSAAIYEGYARVQETLTRDDPVSDTAVLAASSLMIAAAHSCLVEPSRAKLLFLEAALRYEHLEQPFAVVLAVCADEKILIRNHIMSILNRRLAMDKPRPNAIPFVDLIAVMRGLSMPDVNAQLRDVLGSMLDNGQAAAYDPLGRLLVPAHHYHAVARAIRTVLTHNDPTMSVLRDALVSYARRVDDEVGVAMSDRFHWTRLRSGMLPIEPEVLATYMAAEAMTRMWTNQSVSTILTDLLPRQRAAAVVAGWLMDAQSSLGAML